MGPAMEVLKGYELLTEMLAMSNASSKVSLRKATAIQIMTLMPTLKRYLPEDEYVQFYLNQIIPAYESLQSYPEDILDNQTKEVFVEALQGLRVGLADFIFKYFQKVKFDVTPQTILIMRSVVSLVELGREVDE